MRLCEPKRTDNAMHKVMHETNDYQRIDPETWHCDMLERIVSGKTTINRLDELLPWTWKAVRATRDGDTLETKAA